MNPRIERTIIILFLLIFFGLTVYFLISKQSNDLKSPVGVIKEKIAETAAKLSPTPTIAVPESYTITQRHHVFQSFNNCGPATLSMALSYWGMNISQQELGDILRPYQVVGGDNDDKSVTLQEVADQAQEYGLYSYLRPNGTPQMLEKFISSGIPIVARTWLKADEDIGHYRVIRGYDRSTQTLIQDDSLQGKNLTYTYSDFDDIWRPFNYEYLVIVDEEKKELVEQILGEELNEKTAWQNALTRIEDEILQDPDNWHLTFAKSRIYYYLDEYEKSIDEFEKVENRLSFRTLWYQIEPIRSYYEAGNYDRVFNLTTNILNNQNRAFSELYHLRGLIYQKQGNLDLARQEFETALLYKHNYKPSVEALESL